MSSKKDYLRDRRRDAQLLASARDIFSLVLNGELCDPALHELTLVDLTYKSGFAGITVIVQSTANNADHAQIQRKLPMLTDYLRAALAKRLHRKRVPAVRVELLPTLSFTQELRHAHTENAE